MNKAFIKRIDIKNFKGIAEYSHEFDELNNELIASNGCGKSSIKYAWQWVLCQNIPDVLPRLNNKEIPNLITSVELLININNIDYIFKRESKGKYRLNDNNVSCKVTNENSYSIDGISLKENDYKNKISNLLGDGIFETLTMLTDKDMFNSDTTKWKWNDRRKLLFKICNVDSAISSIISKDKYASIKTLILKGNATSDIKSMLAKEKKGYKDIQQRNFILAENKSSEIAEYSKINFEELEKQLQTLNNKLNRLNNSTKKELQTEKLEELQTDLFNYTQELTRLQSADTIALSNIKRFANEIYNECQTLLSNYNNTKSNYDTLIKKYNSVADKVVETICPTCKQELPEDVIKVAQENHEKEVLELDKELQELEKSVGKAKQLYEEKRKLYMDKKQEIDNFVPNKRIKELENAIMLTKTAINDTKISNLNKLSTKDKFDLEAQIKALNEELAKRQFIEKGKAQIQEWQKVSRELADKIVEVEKKETALADFVKEQTDIINNSVNEKFSNGISWSLYNETYKDGDGGIEEDCCCMYKGKRYQSMSTGEKSFADIEVIKVLQNHFAVSLPIFVDNAEQLTLDYNVEDRQIIKLTAQKGAKIENLTKIEELY